MTQSSIVTVGVVALAVMAPIPPTAPRASEVVPFTRTFPANPVRLGGYPTGSGDDTVFRTAWKIASPITRVPLPAAVAIANEVPIESVTTAVHPAEEAIMSRLASIAALQDGWTGKNSKAPADALVTWLQAHRDLLASAPHTVSIIPVSSGALALQWEDADRECTAELHSDDRMLLFVDHLDSDDMDESVATLDVGVLERFLATSELP